jgi:hypothetical protein
MADAAAAATAVAAEAGLSEEEALLQQALAMSIYENEPTEGGEAAVASSGAEEAMEMDEDEAGVDASDPEIQEALRKSQEDKKDESKKE